MTTSLVPAAQDRLHGRAQGPANKSPRRAAPLLVSVLLTAGSATALMVSPQAVFAVTGFAACLAVSLPFTHRAYDLLSPWTPFAIIVYLSSGLRGAVLSLGINGSGRSNDELFFRGKPPAAFLLPSSLYVATLLLAALTFMMFLTPRSDDKGQRETTRTLARYRFAPRTPFIALAMALIGFGAFLAYVHQTGGFNATDLSAKRSVIDGVNVGSSYSGFGVLRALNGFGSVGAWVYMTWAMQDGKVRPLSGRGAMLALLFANAMLLAFYGSTRTDIGLLLIVAMGIYFGIRREARQRWQALRLAGALLLLVLVPMTVLRSHSQAQQTSNGAFSTDELTAAAGEVLVYNRNLGDMLTSSQIMRAVPTVLPYANGETITTWIFAPIPRSLWPDKPLIASGPIIGGAIYGNDHSGIPPGFVAEMYWNFGYLGLAGGGAALGWLMALLHRRYVPVAYMSPALLLICCALPFRFGVFLLSSGVGAGVFNLAVDAVPLLLGLALCGTFNARGPAHLPAPGRLGRPSPS